MKIHSKTKKIFKKVLNLDVVNDKDLKIQIANLCDSLKFLEIFIEIEKNLKINIKNKNIKTIGEVNSLFLK
jgi:acyl carrier protein